MATREQDDRSEVGLRVERYLDALAAGAPIDLEALGNGLEAKDRVRLRAVALANEYLARTTRGESVAAADFAARLAGDDERRLFESVLAAMRIAGQGRLGELGAGCVLDGRYEIRRAIGHGGMGKVYAAFDRELEREVAIKVLALPVGSDRAKEWEELFRRESRSLARLDSRNIVRIHDVRRGSEHNYFVMDLVPGQDLARLFERLCEERARLGSRASRSPEPLRRAVGRSSGGEHADLLGERTHERQVARILRETAHAVELAHEAGIVHRDIKPQNVLLVRGGEPVLLDFGLASWVEGTEKDGIRGTPDYLAPEQIARWSTGNDPRTDVYQLGLVLYELLTLTRAFPRRSGEEIGPLLRKIQDGALTPAREIVPALSPSLEAILAKAIERDPTRRYPSARELREDLDRYLRHLPPLHARVSAARAAGLRALYVARHPASLVAAVALVALLFALREPPWTAPTMDAFRVQNGEVRYLSQSEPLEFEGRALLGLDVRIERPAWLYVFSVFGPLSTREARRIRPVAPDLLADAMQPDYQGSNEPKPIRLGAGRHQIACTGLRNPEPFEGLLVLACAKENELLARWQRTLFDRELDERAPVPLGDAEEIVKALSATMRGESLGALSAEDFKAITSGLVSEPQDPAETWRAHGWARYDFMFPVQRVGGQ